MSLPRLIFLSVLPIACVPGTKSLGDPETGTEGGSSSGSDGSSASATSTSSGTVGSTSSSSAETGLECGPNPCGACEPGCTPMDACVDGQWQCECACDTTSSGTDGMVCELEEIACQAADLSKMPPIDCGVLTLDDPDADWATMSDCILDASTNQVAFKGVADLQGIDSFPRTAFVGQAGAFYALMQFNYDGGGVVPNANIYRTFCTSIELFPDCTPETGNLCLSCVDGDDFELICEE